MTENQSLNLSENQEKSCCCCCKKEIIGDFFLLPLPFPEIVLVYELCTNCYEKLNADDYCVNVCAHCLGIAFYKSERILHTRVNGEDVFFEKLNSVNLRELKCERCSNPLQ
jgi:hypothetical protein